MHLSFMNKMDINEMINCIQALRVENAQLRDAITAIQKDIDMLIRRSIRLESAVYDDDGR